MTHLIPVILSGGAGTRLWPVSREGHPKPFMKLVDGNTLLGKTYRRALQLPYLLKENGVGKVITVTNRDYYFMSQDELKSSGGAGSFILEPFGRNTAPAVALAAHRVNSLFGPDALMLVLSADHLIQDENAFAHAVSQAVSLASAPNPRLVTFGIVPTAPETGFGYLQAGAALDTGFSVQKFVEKPDLEKAKAYLDEGGYYWNSGMFCFSAGLFLGELAKHSPEISVACDRCWQEMERTGESRLKMSEIPEDLFRQVPDLSIDYAVMERSNCVAMVPADIGWNDIGSWNAIRDLVEPDRQNNRALGDAIFVNASNTFVQSEDRLVAAVGVNNLMIIDTPDALLVASPESSQDVKTVVGLLKKADHNTFKLHKTVSRPWGTYTVLEDGPGFKIKRIEVKPAARLSLQMHHHRSEHWIVVKGEAIVVNGEVELLIKANESTYIPAGHKHRLENRTDQDLVMIEVQCGEYLGEDDIVRFEDNYGRV